VREAVLPAVLPAPRNKDTEKAPAAKTAGATEKTG